MSRLERLSILKSIIFMSAALFASPGFTKQAPRWVGAWAASAAGPWEDEAIGFLEKDYPEINASLVNFSGTIRYRARLAQGGSALRISLSNPYQRGLDIENLTIARAAVGLNAKEGTTAVKAFPSGRSPFGCYDMTGNVWQWTESERTDGRTRFCIIRGGAWFDATGSRWYVKGGPQPVDRATKYLLMWAGLHRCGTTGFRCAVDL